jgi:DNA-binding GntR family transcriptional regulator
MKEFEENMDDYLPLRDVVFKTLRQEILTGKLKPGERLLEIHLGNRLGVSRTPIREAIRKLELEGLVTMIPRRGAEVANITEKSLQDVMEVRRALDILAVELACERITEKDLEELKKACEEFEKATETKNTTMIAKADVTFHDIIMNATGNKRLIQMASNLSEQMYRYRFEHIKNQSQHSKLVEEHKKIYENIAAKNTQEAAKAVEIHVDNQENSIIHHLQEEGRKEG